MTAWVNVTLLLLPVITHWKHVSHKYQSRRDLNGHQMHLPNPINPHTYAFLPYFCFQNKRRQREREQQDGWTDKSGNTQVCFDVEGISVVYSKAFHRLLRLSICFLPPACVFLCNLFTSFLESYAGTGHQSSRAVNQRQVGQNQDQCRPKVAAAGNQDEVHDCSKW